MNNTWKRWLTAGSLAAGALLAPAGLAGITTINFDGIASGSLANAAAPVGVSFANAYLVPDLDSFGDPIPGSDKWQIDPLAPPVMAINPLDRSYGVAPSPSNALDAIDQPVLLLFAQPISLGAFKTTLDNSTFGNLFNSPIEFYARVGDTDVLLGSLGVNQTVPGFTASFSGDLVGVSQILLPSGAFYDDIAYTVVPEPASWTVAAGVIALTAFGLRSAKSGV